MEIVEPLDPQCTTAQLQSKDVPAACPVAGDEVQVIARHLDAGRCIREAKPDDGSFDRT